MVLIFFSLHKHYCSVYEWALCSTEKPILCILMHLSSMCRVAKFVFTPFFTCWQSTVSGLKRDRWRCLKKNCLCTMRWAETTALVFMSGAFFSVPQSKDCAVWPLSYGLTTEGGPLMDQYRPAVWPAFTMELDKTADWSAPSHTISIQWKQGFRDCFVSIPWLLLLFFFSDPHRVTASLHAFLFML